MNGLALYSIKVVCENHTYPDFSERLLGLKSWSSCKDCSEGTLRLLHSSYWSSCSIDYHLTTTNYHPFQLAVATIAVACVKHRQVVRESRCTESFRNM